MSTVTLAQPVNLQLDILSTSLSKGAKLLLMALRTFDDNPQLPSKITHKTLGQMINASATSVGRYLKELKACNWITLVANCYRINPDPEQRKSPPPKEVPKPESKQLDLIAHIAALAEEKKLAEKREIEARIKEAESVRGILDGFAQDPNNYCSFLLPDQDYKKWMQFGPKAKILCAFLFYHLLPKGSPLFSESEKVRYFAILPEPNFPFGLPRMEEYEDIRDMMGRTVNFVFRQFRYPKAFMMQCIAELLEKYGPEKGQEKAWDLVWIFNHSVFGIDADPIHFKKTEVAREPRIPLQVLAEIRAKMEREKQKEPIGITRIIG